MAEEGERLEKKRKRLLKDRVLSLLSKIKIPEKLIPKKVRINLEYLLINANMPFSAQEWVAISTVVGLIAFLVIGLLGGIIYGIFAFFGVIALMMFYPKLQAEKRKAQIEEFLPDVLHHMAVGIRSGLVLESVIKNIVESNYGAISEEFAKILVEVRKGRSLRDALLSFAKRTRSPIVTRAITLMIEGLESGAPISDVLDDISEDVRAVRQLMRERRSLTAQQVSFLVMMSVLAGPTVMGIVAGLPNIFAGLGGAEAVPQEINEIIKALNFYVVAQAFATSLMIGVVMYGDIRRGLRFAPPLCIGAYGVFLGVQKVLPGFLGMV